MNTTPIWAARTLEETISPKELRHILNQLWEVAENDEVLTDEERQGIQEHIVALQWYVDQLVWRE